MSKALKALESIRERVNTNDYGFCDPDEKSDAECDVIEKALKALEIIKENLVVSYDESSNDKPCLVIGVKVSKNNLVIIYETYEQDKVDLLKEVLL